MEVALYNNYTLHSNGRVFSKVSNKFLAINTDPKGYPVVSLYIDKVPTKKRVHRLIAKEFLPNPENKRTVNHIDGNKSNNDVSNLEWSTDSENNQHALDTNLRTPRKKLTIEQMHDIMTCTDTAKDMALKYPQVTAQHIRSMRKGKFIEYYKRSELFTLDVLKTKYKSGNAERNK